MARFWLVFIFSCVLVFADPPGGMVKRKVTVPKSMQTAPFNSDQYLTIPPGFDISVFARLEAPRRLAIASNGDVFVSQPSLGKVTVLRPSSTGGDPAAFVYAAGLRSPHGLAFDTVNGSTYLYIAETNQIDRYPYQPGDTSAAASQAVIGHLPDGTEFPGYGHPLKNLAIGPDHSIYVSIGSSCNACADDTTATPVRASVYRYNFDGSGGQLFAQGLRNAEGVAFLPGSATLWVAVNNRDEILYPYKDSSGNYDQLVRSYVDDHPPELFTSVRPNGNYGWPFCNPTQDSQNGYSNMPFDIDLDNNPEVT